MLGLWMTDVQHRRCASLVLFQHTRSPISHLQREVRGQLTFYILGGHLDPGGKSDGEDKCEKCKFGRLFKFHYKTYFCLSCWFDIFFLLNFIWKKIQIHQMTYYKFYKQIIKLLSQTNTCFCRLALLRHIPQKVLLNTNLLWKSTWWLPSVHTSHVIWTLQFPTQITDLTSLLLFMILSYMLSMAYFICPVWFNLQRWQVKSKFRVQFSKHPQHHSRKK